MTMSWKFSVVGFLIATCFGCGPPDSEVGTSTLAGLGTQEYLWPKTELVVCFNRSEYKVKGRDSRNLETTVKNAVQKGYTFELTGISFEGFKPCDSKKADVAVIFIDSLPSSGAANRVGTYKLPAEFSELERQQLPTVAFSPPVIDQNRDQLSFSSNLIETALHEFAHIAGLNHEHAHPNSTCKASEDAAFGRSIMKKGYQDFGLPYDPYSVTSYCKNIMLAGTEGLPDEYIDHKIDKSKLRIGLSAGDRRLLKQLYRGKKPNAGSSFVGGASPPPTQSGGCAVIGGTVASGPVTPVMLWVLFLVAPLGAVFTRSQKR